MCNIIAASEDSKNSSFYGLKPTFCNFQHFWRENSNICWIDFTVQLTLISRTKGLHKPGFFANWILSKMEHYFVLLFCATCSFILDYMNYWQEGILKWLGTDLFVHHFLITYLLTNAVFYSLGLFLTSFDLQNYSKVKFAACFLFQLNEYIDKWYSTCVGYPYNNHHNRNRIQHHQNLTLESLLSSVFSHFSQHF